MEFHRGLVAQYDGGWAKSADEPEPISHTEKVVALPAHHLALGLPGLCCESGPLALDPSELADHC